MMTKELDEQLRKILGPLRPLDKERLTSCVMELLKQESRKQRASFLSRCFRRLIPFNSGVLKAADSSQRAEVGRSERLPKKYATAFKAAAGIAAAVLLLASILIPLYGPSKFVEPPEPSQIFTKQNDTLPGYVLNERIRVRIEETKPCDILPPLID
ncbi:MAG: hypothetical protein ACYSUY_11755 [Planctomycetota bacterium]|jgi:hypothetical protein